MSPGQPRARFCTAKRVAVLVVRSGISQNCLSLPLQAVLMWVGGLQTRKQLPRDISTSWLVGCKVRPAAFMCHKCNRLQVELLLEEQRVDSLEVKQYVKDFHEEREGLL